MERDAVLTSKPPSAQLNIVSSAFTQTELLQKEVRARALPRPRETTAEARREVGLAGTLAAYHPEKGHRLESPRAPSFGVLLAEYHDLIPS